LPEASEVFVAAEGLADFTAEAASEDFTAEGSVAGALVAFTRVALVAAILADFAAAKKEDLDAPKRGTTRDLANAGSAATAETMQVPGAAAVANGAVALAVGVAPSAAAN
jgi:hypothetical protein